MVRNEGRYRVRFRVRVRIWVNRLELALRLGVG